MHLFERILPVARLEYCLFICALAFGAIVKFIRLEQTSCRSMLRMHSVLETAWELCILFSIAPFYCGVAWNVAMLFTDGRQHGVSLNVVTYAWPKVLYKCCNPYWQRILRDCDFLH